MLPVSLSVMKRSRPSRPPRQRLVVDAPTQEVIASVGSARALRRQTVPTPVWATSRFPSGSQASPSGPPGPPWRWRKIPAFVTAPSACSGRRQIWLARVTRSEEHTSELQSRQYLVCRLLLEKKKTIHYSTILPSFVSHTS